MLASRGIDSSTATKHNGKPSQDVQHRFGCTQSHALVICRFQESHIDALIQNGAVSFQCQFLGERYRKNDVTAPGWSSVLTGVWADKHGVQANSFKVKHFGTYPHLFASRSLS